MAPRFSARDAASLAVMSGKRHVFQERELAKRPWDLEGAGNASPTDRVRGKTCDVLALEADRSGRRAQVAGNQIERRALARAVRADQAQNFTLADFEGDLVDRQETAEALGQPLDCEHLQRMA